MACTQFRLELGAISSACLSVVGPSSPPASLRSCTPASTQYDDLLEDANPAPTLQAARLAVSRFEWVDGALTRAVETGQWILLDNANLCNPTVLDRLNALLEPGGQLMLNEAGSSSGQARVVAPHPNFRLFLAMSAR